MNGLEFLGAVLVQMIEHSNKQPIDNIANLSQEENNQQCVYVHADKSFHTIESANSRIDWHPYLKVMIFNCHFNIKANELTQMPVGVGVFCSEHGANLEDALEPTAHGHLLVELRRLRQASRLAVVVQLEHRRAALARPGYQLRRVDANETF